MALPNMRKTSSSSGVVCHEVLPNSPCPEEHFSLCRCGWVPGHGDHWRVYGGSMVKAHRRTAAHLFLQRGQGKGHDGPVHLLHLRITNFYLQGVLLMIHAIALYGSAFGTFVLFVGILSSLEGMLK